MVEDKKIKIEPGKKPKGEKIFFFEKRGSDALTPEEQQDLSQAMAKRMGEKAGHLPIQEVFDLYQTQQPEIQSPFLQGWSDGHARRILGLPDDPLALLYSRATRSFKSANKCSASIFP